MKFEEAYKRLKEINDMLKDEELIDIDKIVSLQKEAKQLYDFCEKELKKVEEDNN